MPTPLVAAPDGGGARLARLVGVERVVELGGGGAGDHVRVGRLAEVDPRLPDRHLGLGVDAADEVVRRPLRRDRVDRHRGDAEAVRVHQRLVGPGAVVAEERHVELAGAEHELALLVVDVVAVDVDVGEGVVAPQDLLLPEGRQERPVVPQAQVVDGALLALEDLAGQLLLAGEASHVDGVEVERGSGGVEVAGQVWPLPLELVRLDLHRLHEGRVQPADHDREHQPRAGRQGDQPQGLEPGVQEQQRSRHDGDDGEDHVRGQLRVHVGVQRRLEPAVHAPRRVRQLGDVELVAGGDDEQEQGADDRHVAPAPARTGGTASAGPARRRSPRSGCR